MSRKSQLWKRKIAQAGSVDKVIPRNVTGAGQYLTKADIPGRETKPAPGTGKGNQVTLPMNTEKESRIRKLGK